MFNPLVSVIIPLYNAEAYIGQCINSVLAQTWANIEIIVVNDGSKDRSAEIVKSLDSPKIILINQHNQGASAAKQKGLDNARGEFIQYLDADDLLAANKIEMQVVALEHEPGKVAVCKTTHFFDNDDHLVNNIPDDDRFFTEYLNEPLNFLIKLNGGFDLIGGMIQPNAFLTPMSVIKEAGPWNSSISPCTDEDGEYFTRVVLKSKGVIYQPQALNYYRKLRNKKSLSGILNNVTYKNLIESVWLKHLHLMACAESDYQKTCIHNATFLLLDRIKIQIYYTFEDLVAKILSYQNQLSPSLKPVYDKLGGGIINFITKNFGWKVARKLQQIVRGT